MVGYSGTPLPKKLGLAAGQRVAILGGPHGFARDLGDLSGVDVEMKLVGRRPYDTVILFARWRAELAHRFGPTAARLTPAGSLWVAWPKKASGVPSDLTEGVAREIGLPEGLVDVKVCAIDATWSGLKFVWRKENRPHLER
jgi:hypothetical protein